MGRMKLKIREIVPRVFNVLVSRAVRNSVWGIKPVTLEKLAERHMPDVR